MKEIYLQKNSHNSGRARPFVGVTWVIAITLILWLALYFLPNFSNSLSLFLARPLWSARNFVTTELGFLSNMLRARASLVEENENLKTEIARAKADLVFYEALETEHKKLIESFGRNDASSRRLAVILAKPPQSPYDTLVLDIGSLSGIQSGDIVYGFGNIALGQVSSTDQKRSSVTLFSSGGFESHGVVERSDFAIALSGVGAGGFESRVPQDADIAVDDIIILPGQEPAPLGKVVKIESTPASSFKLVQIRSLVNLNSTRWVEVETASAG